MTRIIKTIWIAAAIVWLCAIGSAIGAEYNGANADLPIKTVLVLNCKPEHMRVKPECLAQIEPAADDTDEAVMVEESDGGKTVNYE